MPTAFFPIIGRLQSQTLFEITGTAGYRRISAIYAIVHRSTGRVYVGSTASIKTRVSYHRSKLRNTKHDNSYLQNSWNKYGEDAFSFVILELCEVSHLLDRESYWMDQTGCCDKSVGFNLDTIAVRKMHCEETKAKIGAAHKGKIVSAETRQKLSVLRIGVSTGRRTPEQRINYSRARVGKKHSPETIAKLCAQRRGRKLTPEWRAKCTAVLKNNHLERKLGKEKCQLLFSL